MNRTALTAGLLLGLLGPLTASTASADDGRVLGIIAPVLDISVNTADLEGGARVEEAPDRVDVRLDSTVLFAKDSPRLRPRLPAADYAFTVLGRGEAGPAVPNDSEAHREVNRRVELTYRPS